ncbi:TPA: 50S ribosomal protein L22 [Candidatus Woesearchaeota archaeon]|nr:50S ribosomal protein L22 [Candidatus Woesearchaeota archaeon]
MVSHPTKTTLEHLASARATNLTISTRHSVELANSLRYKDVSYARKFLEDVLNFKRAVPFTRHTFDLGHKPGIGPGRYPQKATQEFLRLLASVEKNAQYRGLDTTRLKIVGLVVNKASIPMNGGRNRHAGRRTHIAIHVAERKSAKTGSSTSTKSAAVPPTKTRRSSSSKAETVSKEEMK